MAFSLLVVAYVFLRRSNFLRHFLRVHYFWAVLYCGLCFKLATSSGNQNSNNFLWCFEHFGCAVVNNYNRCKIQMTLSNALKGFSNANKSDEGLFWKSTWAFLIFCSNGFYVRLCLSSIRMRLKNYDVQILLLMWHSYKVHINPRQVFSAKSQKSIKIAITCPEIIVIIDFYWQIIITNQWTVTACINKYS